MRPQISLKFNNLPSWVLTIKQNIIYKIRKGKNKKITKKLQYLQINILTL
jgi:hypothetical protein